MSERPSHLPSSEEVEFAHGEANRVNMEKEEKRNQERYGPGWRQRSIEMSHHYQGQPRGIDAYEIALGVNVESLRGTTNLDLGTGKEAQLAREISEAGIDTKIICASPDFLYRDIRQKALAAHPEMLGVATVGQGLPFRDSTFDNVFVLHVLEHVKGPENFLAFLEETARVLKSGGHAYLGPVFSYMRDFLRENKELLNTLETSVSITEEEIPEEYAFERLYTDYGVKTDTRIPYTRMIMEKLPEETNPKLSR